MAPVFGYPMIAGDPATALVDPLSLVLTESMAKRMFGSEDPMGKTVKVDNSMALKITGVIKDLPANSQIQLEWVNSYNYKNMKGYIDSDWTGVNNRTFVLLRPGASLDAVNKQMPGMISHYSGGRAGTDAFLYPMSRLHLYSEFDNGKVVGGRIATVRLFGLIAFLILVIGAGQGSLILQFLGESMAIALIAGVLALGVVQVSLPYFNTLTDKHLSMAYDSVGFWAGALPSICLTGLLAGSYPAFFLSAFRPVSVLKGVFKKTNALRLVLLSILIATPISWYAMHQWLEGFTYRTSLSGWLFATAGGMAVLIAVVTVSVQALRAALANPVKSLRTE